MRKPARPVPEAHDVNPFLVAPQPVDDAIRPANHLAQIRLPELVDLNIRTVQKIEAGEFNILLTTVLRLQKALGCSWENLLVK
jgi:DNA-binding XRE family transcriptional regulator